MGVPHRPAAVGVTSSAHILWAITTREMDNDWITLPVKGWWHKFPAPTLETSLMPPSMECVHLIASRLLLAKIPTNGASLEFACTFHHCRGGTSAGLGLECRWATRRYKI